MQKIIDYYGGAHYLKVILKHHPHGFFLGILDSAPGWNKGLPIITAMGDSNRRWKGARVSGIWHDNHYFTKADIRPAIKISERMSRVIEPYPKKIFFLQPWLEAECSVEAMEECIKECRKVLPRRVKLVSSIVVPKGLVEYHHTNNILDRPHLASYDGVDMLTEVSKQDVKEDMAYHEARQCKVFGGWCAACNMKKYPREKITREARVKRGYHLRRRHIKAMERRMR